MFGLVKICATKVGETGGDSLSTTFERGYALATAILVSFFNVALAARLGVRFYRPAT
jgi:uncharacterized membrane-anchored protein